MLQKFILKILQAGVESGEWSGLTLAGFRLILDLTCDSSRRSGFGTLAREMQGQLPSTSGLGFG